MAAKAAVAKKWGKLCGMGWRRNGLGGVASDKGIYATVYLFTRKYIG
jgi:hypothetical protein